MSVNQLHRQVRQLYLQRFVFRYVQKLVHTDCGFLAFSGSRRADIHNGHNRKEMDSDLIRKESDELDVVEILSGVGRISEDCAQDVVAVVMKTRKRQSKRKAIVK